MIIALHRTVVDSHFLIPSYNVTLREFIMQIISMGSTLQIGLRAEHRHPRRKDNHSSDRCALLASAAARSICPTPPPSLPPPAVGRRGAVGEVPPLDRPGTVGLAPGAGGGFGTTPGLAAPIMGFGFGARGGPALPEPAGAGDSRPEEGVVATPGFFQGVADPLALAMPGKTETGLAFMSAVTDVTETTCLTVGLGAAELVDAGAPGGGRRAVVGGGRAAGLGFGGTSSR